MNNISIYYPKGMQDALYHLRTVTDLSIAAGCTGIMNAENPVNLAYPDSILNVRKIDELLQVTKTERFVEFGAAVTLSHILEYDPKNQLTVLHDAIKTVANTAVRNMATIGGNICTQPVKMTLFAPLLALDAKLIFCTNIERKSIATGKKHAAADRNMMSISLFTQVMPGYFLSKVHIPLEEWDIAIFKRVGPKHTVNNRSASFAFLANTQKNMLTDVRIAYCGVFSFRDRDLENSFIGHKLPLSPKIVQAFGETTLEAFDDYIQKSGIECKSILRTQFINLVKDALENLE